MAGKWKSKADCTPEEWAIIRAKRLVTEKAYRDRRRDKLKELRAKRNLTEEEQNWLQDHINRGRKRGRRKADCTPEEWAAYLEKQSQKRARQRAQGHRPPSMQPEIVNKRRKEWIERHKGTERYAFQMSERQRRARERDPEGYLAKKREWKRNNPDKVREWRRSYALRKKQGLVASKSHIPMTGERVWALTLEALRGKYDEPNRMDIAGEAMVAFLEGDALNIKDAVALGMKRHWRMFSKFTTRSLDAEIAEGLRLIDLIADDAPRAGYTA